MFDFLNRSTLNGPTCATTATTAWTISIKTARLWNHVHLQKFKSDSIPSCWKYISALSLAQSLKLSNNSGTAGGKCDQLPNDYAAGLALATQATVARQKLISLPFQHFMILPNCCPLPLRQPKSSFKGFIGWFSMESAEMWKSAKKVTTIADLPLLYYQLILMLLISYWL